MHSNGIVWTDLAATAMSTSDFVLIELMLYHPKTRWWTLDDDTSNKAIEQSSNINQRSIHLCESMCLSNRIFPSSKLEWKDIYIKNRSLYNLIFCILWSTPPYLEPWAIHFSLRSGPWVENNITTHNGSRDPINTDICPQRRWSIRPYGINSDVVWGLERSRIAGSYLGHLSG